MSTLEINYLGSDVRNTYSITIGQHNLRIYCFLDIGVRLFVMLYHIPVSKIDEGEHLSVIIKVSMLVDRNSFKEFTELNFLYLYFILLEKFDVVLNFRNSIVLG